MCLAHIQDSEILRFINDNSPRDSFSISDSGMTATIDFIGWIKKMWIGSVYRILILRFLLNLQ